jgi:hypothetical protein
MKRRNMKPVYGAAEGSKNPLGMQADTPDRPRYLSA